MLSYVAILILKELITPSFATKYVAPSPDFVTRAQYCLIKNELPSELKITPQNDDKKSIHYFEILNYSNQKAIIYDEKNLNNNFKLPENLNPNHLPVAYLKKNEFFRNSFKSGFQKEESNLNPLGERLWGPMVIFTGIKLFKEYKIITDKIKDSFFEMPLKYYYNNEFVNNKIYFYTKKNTGVREEKSLDVVGIKFLKPLPKGLTIKVTRDVIDADLNGYYSSLVFTNTNESPILFVKEFEKPVENFTLIKQGVYPYYIGSNKSCSRFNLENKIKTAELERKTFLEEFTKKHTNLIQKMLLIIKNETILEDFKDEEVDTIVPFGYVFNTPSMLKTECVLDISHLDHDSESEKITSDELPSRIVIPDEKITEINLLFNQKIQKLRTVKRYVKNPDWVPLSQKKRKWASCSGNCEDVKKMKEKEIKVKNLLKLVPEIKSPSPFRDEDLICVLGSIY